MQVGLSSATLTALTQLPSGVPKGYLRVLSFNEDSVLVDQRTVQLSAAALNNYEPLQTGPLVVQQNGYVTVYVGNESAADVYFDDVRIEHRQGLQVQENQYDPFGLDLAGVSGAAPGLPLKNFYQFNGKENQLDLGLNWNHQDWRFYDYQIGRWHVVDPEIENAQESWGPYSFGFDNAVRYADANGRNPGDGEPVGTLAGLIRNTVIGIGVSAFNVVQSVLPFSPVAIAMNGGNPIPNVRASVDDYGNVSARVRPVNATSDALDYVNVAAVAFSAGGAGLATRALPMGAGLLLAEAGGEKVVANSVVQEGKKVLGGFSHIEGHSKATGLSSEIPRVGGFPVGDPSAVGRPHTTLGISKSHSSQAVYNQAAEIGKDGKAVKEIHFTDHNSPGRHPNPHQHNMDHSQPVFNKARSVGVPLD